MLCCGFVFTVKSFKLDLKCFLIQGFNQICSCLWKNSNIKRDGGEILTL